VGVHEERRAWSPLSLNHLVENDEEEGTDAQAPLEQEKPKATTPTSIPTLPSLRTPLPSAPLQDPITSQVPSDASPIEDLMELPQPLAQRQTRSNTTAPEWSKVWGTAQEESTNAFLSQTVRLKEAEAWGSEAWRPAMESELKSLTGLGTFELVSRSSVPTGEKPIGCRWVLAKKMNDGKAFHKARERRAFRKSMAETTGRPGAPLRACSPSGC
jgi:hypothetical protein